MAVTAGGGGGRLAGGGGVGGDGRRVCGKRDASQSFIGAASLTFSAVAC